MVRLINIIREIQKRLFPKTLKCVYRKDILEYALKHHRYNNGENHGGLCVSINKALEHYGIYTKPMLNENIIPLFTNNNASSLFNATSYCDSYQIYWWPKGRWNTGRLDFLKWLIEQYKDDKTNLKEL